jgi:hypothetical protein
VIGSQMDFFQEELDICARDCGIWKEFSLISGNLRFLHFLHPTKRGEVPQTMNSFTKG